MLESVRIRNFRGLHDLEIGEIARLNLFSGLNNSGKTSLLEALFLLSGGGNPGGAILTARGVDSAAGRPEAVADVLWKPMFSGLDIGKNIEISGRYAPDGDSVLRISRSRTGTIRLPRDGKGAVSTTELPNEQTLVFSFQDASGKNTEGSVRLTEEGIKIEAPESEIAYPAAILTSKSGSHREDALRLGQLRVHKNHKFIEGVLRVIEPRLKSVEDSSASGHSMIWVDVDHSELLPLPMMGEGMSRVARLALAISAVPGGVVLVDEIENGLHHSVISGLWRATNRI